LGIRHVGERVAALLAARYGSMEALAMAQAEELAEINEIGPVIAESVCQFFANEANRQTIARLQAASVHMVAPVAAEAGTTAPQVLAGKVFVLTGTLPNLTRQEAQARIVAAGGRVTSSVTRKTHYVVAGAEPGSKYQQAERLGVPILDEAEFARLLASPALSDEV
ncbi:MAG: NAD-dependent DNA ligase LigA, partial [Candidatus Tectomicrobia bacterium]|nr:NAD-dependent DNA ligase LigA [Candidatus Tectomicrobia bacterium]